MVTEQELYKLLQQAQKDKSYKQAQAELLNLVPSMEEHTNK